MNDKQDKLKVVKWDELEKCSESFQYWVDWDLNVRWVEQSWFILEKYGLTSYASNSERCKIIIRFLALIEILTDFYYVQWSISPLVDLVDVAGELRIKRKSVINFAKIDLSWFEKETLLGLLTPKEVYFDAILASLCDEARPEILKALVMGYGDEVNLFWSLCRCNPNNSCYGKGQIPPNCEDCHYEYEEGLSWVCLDGCDSLRWTRPH